MKDGLYTRHEVACIIADLLGGTCACDYSGNDEWLPYYCEVSDSVCPNTVGVACWEQYLLYRNRGREVCGNCKHNKRAVDEYSQCEWRCCRNEKSDKYAVPTFYDDTCEDWEERDD